MKSVYGSCPFATTQRALQGKWAIVILFQLSTGTQRFNELEDDRLITRKVYAEVPPRVEYSLSDMGEKFRKVLEQIEIFGLEYIEELKKTNTPIRS